MVQEFSIQFSPFCRYASALSISVRHSVYFMLSWNIPLYTEFFQDSLGKHNCPGTCHYTSVLETFKNVISLEQRELFNSVQCKYIRTSMFY